MPKAELLQLKPHPFICMINFIMLVLAPHGLETRVIIFATQEPLTSFHAIKQNFFISFFEKKVQNGPLKKTMFFKTVNSQYFFMKLSGIC